MTEIPHSAQLNGFTCADMCHVRYALAFMRRPRATMPQLRPACRRAPPGPRARSRLATVPRVREQLHRCAVPASRRRLTACPAAPSSCRAPPRQRRAAAGRACSCCSPRPETPHAGCMRQQQRDSAQLARDVQRRRCNFEGPRAECPPARGMARRERWRVRRAPRGTRLARAALLLLLLLLGSHALQAALGRGSSRALQLALLRLLGGSCARRARAASVSH